MKKEVNIGVLGYGNIGSAVVDLIKKNSGLIEEKTGISLKVKAIAEVSKKKKHPLIVRDANKIIKDPKISIIVETIGGDKIAKKFILAALSAGKHVVTPNKEVISKNLPEFLKVAKRNKVGIKFEAAVGGGIPIIRPILNSLAGNKIEEIYGIVNGTTNYILSKMTQEGLEFKEALAQAQKKGFAEPDPTLDINGFDAVCKASILAAVAYGVHVLPKDIPMQGITNISLEDVRYAQEIGYVIKLIAFARKINGKLDIGVRPVLIPKKHPLAAVSDNFNAIYVKGAAIGKLMFYGQGAGGGPTASAVLSDIMSLAQRKEPKTFKVKTVKVKKMDDLKNRYYVRLLVPDRHGVLSGISGVFASEKASIQTVMQKESVGDLATLVIILHQVSDRNMARAIKRISKLQVVKKVCSVLRVGLD